LSVIWPFCEVWQRHCKEEQATKKVHEPLLQAHGWTLMHDFSSLSITMKNFHEDVAEFNDDVTEMDAMAVT
jgi:hypothetical protein